MSEPVVVVEGLSKSFGGVEAVCGLNFTVGPTEVLGLLGPNGAGKTTTIHMLLGLVTPTAGRVRLFGMELDTNRVAVLSRLNFSSAYIALPSNLTVWENLNVFSRLYGLKKPRKKIEELLELFEISHVLNRVTGGLSSGQQTRVNLCKSFLNDPELLILDEPTASLDPDIADKVHQVLNRIRNERDMAMIYTSHNMAEIEKMCDRIAFISQGRFVLEGTTAELLAQSGRASLEELFIAIARDRGLPGEAP
ncbi:MAG: ABC transporter ATP-binding protein [Bradymonadaceae bacterium]|nr:ABC transporter ATP-binding protein [Lujinxingiaceae bacterium]